MRLSLPPVCRGAAAAAACALAVCVSSPMAAQELRGIVRDSVARQPIPAVVLIVADSDGTPIVRKLTDGARSACSCPRALDDSNFCASDSGRATSHFRRRWTA